MVRLFILDLDGTLLRKNKTISPYTASVLEACKKEGIKLAVATARGETNVQSHFKIIKPDFLISSNGAMVSMGDAIISCCEFSPDETAKMIEKGFQVTKHECEVTVDTRSQHFWNYKIDPHMESPDWGVVVYTDYVGFREKSLKVCMELKQEKQAEEIAACVNNCIYTKFSNGNWFQFTKKDASKWNAVQKICAKMNISIQDTVAFGDDQVDMEILKYCGIGVAMENALDEVKQVADDVTCSNDDDGVAKWIEKYITKKTEVKDGI